MNLATLEKLQWPLLVEKLAAHAMTEEGRELCLHLKPDLTQDTIEFRWRQAEPLKNLAKAGYRPPIGQLPFLEPIFKGARLGQILDGESLRTVYNLLTAAKQVHNFSRDFVERCPTLDRYYKMVYPLPNLSQAIEKAVGPDGHILDTASKELESIRRGKMALRKKIEEQLQHLLSTPEWETYLQDKFFTLRSDRYVVPIRLDGRGRVKGTIYDTSESGQSLFIEPAPIAPMNEALQELELSEKLEILRIYKELSAHVAQELDTLSGNYDLIVELDFFTAQGLLAIDLDAVPVAIAKSPGLHLIDARHPLVTTPDHRTAVANNITLNPEQTTLIVSGPNAGGKTVVLKTTGLLHLMVKAGLMIPAERESQVYLFRQIFIEIGDAQNLTANLSTFSGHIMGLKPIVEQAGADDLALMDELAVGTEPLTGSAIAQAVLEHLADRRVTTVTTTHFDNLKGLAVQDQRFRNGSMEYSLATLHPTYKLLLDIPGQSYGLEVAEQAGLPKPIIGRARELRGQGTSALDRLLDDLQRQKDDIRQEEQQWRDARHAMEAEKAHWERERAALDEVRKKQVHKLTDRYEAELREKKQEFFEILDQLKKMLKDRGQSLGGDLEDVRGLFAEQRRKGEEALKGLGQSLDKLESDYQPSRPLPGKEFIIEQAKVGDTVYVISIGKEAQIIRVQAGPSPMVEVQAGLLKLRPALSDLRAKGDKSAPPAGRDKKSPTPRPKVTTTSPTPQGVGFVLQSPTNSVDLKGLDADQAVDRMWQFVDKAVMRGESHVVLIHGHGTDTLKRAVRTALAKNPPYSLDFRPGEAEEGGDGVTVVELKL